MPLVTRFSHSSCTAISGSGRARQREVSSSTSAAPVEISRYVTLRMLSYAKRPSSTPASIDAKLSSVTISEAVSLVTSEPEPIATPMLRRPQGGGVVDAVAGHGDEVSGPAKPRDDMQLLQRRHAREHPAAADARGERLALRRSGALELRAGHDLRVGGGDPELARDGVRRERVVPGDHRHAMPAALAPPDGRLGLGRGGSISPPARAR
jgi:hypothetical protein